MKRVINVHAHLKYDVELLPNKRFRISSIPVDEYVEHAKKQGIEKTWLMIGHTSGIRTRDEDTSNEDVLEIAKRYSDFFIPVARIWFGEDKPEHIARYREKGFKALKAIKPPLPYDADEYMVLYREAAKQGLPILFHTGWVAVGHPDRYDFPIKVDNMRPMRLDTIAREFPDLRMILNFEPRPQATFQVGIPGRKDLSVKGKNLFHSKKFRENLFFGNVSHPSPDDDWFCVRIQAEKANRTLLRY